ncbi:MAG: NAD(P)H-binding protein [Ktedonobacterales bacterium]
MILVTGADGFVASHLIRRLVDNGESPRALVRNVTKARSILPTSGVDIFAGDTTKPATLEPALIGVDTVIHGAFVVAVRKEGPGVNYYATNVTGTKNLVQAARNAGVQRIAVLGGLGTKPSATDHYMQGRYEADEAVKNSGLAWSIIGPSVQFGEHSAFFSGLANLIRHAPVIPMIGSGQRQFQPIWVEDVATCVVKMVKEPERYDGRYIEVGGPAVYTYSQILDMLMRRIGTTKPKVPGPVPLVRIGAGVMQLVLKNPPITQAAVGLFDFDNVTALDSVATNFGFAPLSFETYLSTHDIE